MLTNFGYQYKLQSNILSLTEQNNYRYVNYLQNYLYSVVDWLCFYAWVSKSSDLITIFDFFVLRHQPQGGRGHWIVNYTGSQKFIFMIYYWLAQKHWILLLILISWFKLKNVWTFQLIILVHWWGKFGPSSFGMNVKLSPLSYPFKSLHQP